MGAPHTEKGSQVVDLLHSLSKDELADAIAAINRTGCGFVAVPTEAKTEIAVSLQWLRGYVVGKTSETYWQILERTSGEARRGNEETLADVLGSAEYHLDAIADAINL